MVGHRRDMESDFSAFHRLRVAEVYALPGPEFCALAYRLPAYPGALQARVRMETADQEGRGSDPGRREVSSNRAVLATTPELNDLFDMNTTE